MTRIYVLVLAITIFFIGPAIAHENGSRFTSFAGFELGKVNLKQVTDELGPAQLLESGDAGGYEAKICYRTNAGVVYFLSGEMGGPEHDLLGFGIKQNNENDPCSEFPKNHAPVKLNLGGLVLGMTKAEFLDVVSTKIQWKGNVGRAFFESQLPISPSEFKKFGKDIQDAIQAGKVQNYFDVTVTVEGVFSENNLKALQVWKVVTF